MGERVISCCWFPRRCSLRSYTCAKLRTEVVEDAFLAVMLARFGTFI